MGCTPLSANASSVRLRAVPRVLHLRPGDTTQRSAAGWTPLTRGEHASHARRAAGALVFNYVKVAPGVYDAMDALDQYLAAMQRSRSAASSRSAPRVAAQRLRLLHRHALEGSSRGWARRSSGSTRWMRGVSARTTPPASARRWPGRSHHAHRRRSGCPSGVYAEVRPHFDDTELADLTLAVATINAWNRLSIAARLTPGSYQPSKVIT